MTEYTIDSRLLAKALQESAAGWRRKLPAITEGQIKNQFYLTWKLVTGNNDSYVPYTREPVLRPEPKISERLAGRISPQRMEQLADRVREANALSQERARSDNEYVAATHRAGLILLLTTGPGGISQSTAEKIVDNHILIHKK